MTDSFHAVVRRLTGAGGEPLSGLDAAGQFRPFERDDVSFPRNINASFLVALCGKSHPRYGEAWDYLETMRYHRVWGHVAEFYFEGLRLVSLEVQRRCEEDSGFRKALEDTAEWVANPESVSHRAETIEKLWRVFFPEGEGVCANTSGRVRELREKRKILITSLNPRPLENPAREILFTSNILLTVPLDPGTVDELDISGGLKERVREVLKEEQRYWYDHPIPMGIAHEKNEAIYGLRGLDEALEFEKQRGTMGRDERAACALSVSVTHSGLQGLAKEFLEEELGKGEGLRHLDVHIFTEADTSRLIDEVLAPAMEKYLGSADVDLLCEVIGVDGEYGRHYTFLKAAAALWQVLVDPGIKGTFKTDLDQVFPQSELVGQGGASALEHLKTPLWGAEGTDSRGKKVELGLIAGALVNEHDISEGIFTPDVCYPAHEVKADELVFFSPLPQALSTEAEMMARYEGGELDGKTACLERIHVTGGTNGILVDSLRRHRPFTPVFIGRAEDQAYLMSVLFREGEKNLRYVHAPGLIMRHDKEAFASEAMEAARVGKMIGDYARILWFSYYARSLPWTVEEIKEAMDPFTGCFVSHVPLTVVFLRLALKAASLFQDGDGKMAREGVEFLGMGARRLDRIIRLLNREPNPLIQEYRKEKEVWDSYYEVLEHLEKGIEAGDEFALGLKKKAEEIVSGCRLG